jgi:hypothetical protein
VLRAWARKRGMQVGDRGRLSPDVLAAWRAAHAGPPTARRAAAGKPRSAAKAAAARNPGRPAAPEAAPSVPDASAEEHPATVARIADLKAQITALTARVQQLEQQPTPEPRRRRGLRRR